MRLLPSLVIKGQNLLPIRMEWGGCCCLCRKLRTHVYLCEIESRRLLLW